MKQLQYIYAIHPPNFSKMKTRFVLTLVVASFLSFSLYAQKAVGADNLRPHLLAKSGVQENASSLQASSSFMMTGNAYGFRLPETDYAQKAKSQQTVAWVLAGAGAAMVVTGLIVGGKDEDTVGETINNAFDGTIMVVGGAIVAAGSIPFFISASKNKAKAGLTGSVMLQSAVASTNSGMQRVKQPAVGLQWHF